MKTDRIFCLILCIVFVNSLPVIADQFVIKTDGLSFEDSANRACAKIDKPRFEFEPVVDGTVITHDFVISNEGNQPLYIRDVVTNCGCTKAEFTKEILPGEEGKINIKFDSNGYGGLDTDRKIMVSTNDPDQPVFYLNLAGKVETFADIDPKNILLQGSSKDQIQTSVTITPKKQYPFNILKTRLDDRLKGNVSITMKKDNGNYIVHAENLSKVKSRYAGRFYLETDSTIKPEIKIIVKAIID